MKSKLLLEVVWIVAVVAILGWAAAGNASYTLSHGNNIANPVGSDPQGVVINVTGRQWQWQFEYPNGTTMSDKLVLQVNTTYVLVVTSADVVHDLYIPQFGVQAYAVNGHVNQVSFEPMKKGRYIMECVEYCGEYHYEMRGWVTVT